MSINLAYWKWWLRREAGAISILLGLVAASIALGIFAFAQSREPERHLVAKIVRFGTSHDGEGNSPLVIVRTADGRLLQLHTRPSSLSACRKGDNIALVVRGSVTTVKGEGCRRLHP